MIISFCGHSDSLFIDGLEDKVLNEIEKVASGKPVTFYLGGYGYFDGVAFSAAQKYKEKHNNSTIVFVTPYLDTVYLKNREPIKVGYDKIIYPSIEKIPKRFAILERNKFMMKSADFIVACVKFSWGGAAKSLNFAKKLKKNYVNLAENY